MSAVGWICRNASWQPLYIGPEIVLKNGGATALDGLQARRAEHAEPLHARIERLRRIVIKRPPVEDRLGRFNLAVRAVVARADTGAPAQTLPGGPAKVADRANVSPVRIV